jgi:transcriptional regulator with XRE-family HTH domain
MITNMRQYKATRAAIKRLEDALASAARSETEPSIRDLLTRGIEQQLEQLREEIRAFEAVRQGSIDLRLASFEDLPTMLIQGRIAAGLTQAALADKLGLKEQQIQRYEQTGYAQASLTRVLAVASALGLSLREPGTVGVSVQQPASSPDADDLNPTIELGRRRPAL